MKAHAPWPARGMHLEMTFADSRLVATRMVAQGGEDDPLPPPARDAVDAVARHFRTGREDLSGIPVDLAPLPPFQRRVLEALRGVPAGATVTYGELARRAGNPAAARAVGAAMARNPLCVVVPCHRVLPSDGRVGHYSALGGGETKRALLSLEGAAGWR